MVSSEANVLPADQVAEEVRLPSGRNSVDYELHPVGNKEMVPVASDIVKDKKTGRHYRRVKKPSYNIARNKGAARIEHSNYHGAPIGLGHTLPSSHRGGGGGGHGGHGGGGEAAQTEAQREQAMFERMRVMMREEMRRVQMGHSDQIKQHIDDAMEKNAEGDSNNTVSSERRLSKSKTGDDVTYLDPSSAERGDDELDDDEAEFPNPWARIRYHCREPFAEFLACFVLLTFGDGINVQVQLSTLVQPNAPRGDYLSVSFGWGIAVMAAVFVAGGISGGHVNPAVTLALAVFRGFPWRKVPGYILAQLLGGICGALCIYGLYVIPIRMVDPGQTQMTAQLFCTFPAVSEKSR